MKGKSEKIGMSWLSFLIVGLALLVVFSVPVSAASYGTIIEGLNEIGMPDGIPGSIGALTTQPEKIVFGDEDSHSAYYLPGDKPPLVMAREYENYGRVISIGHEGYFTGSNIDRYDNLQLGLNSIKWLDKDETKKILFDWRSLQWGQDIYQNGLINSLRVEGYTVDVFDGEVEGDVSAEYLANYGIYMICTSWASFTQGEIDAIVKYVQQDGGGLFLTGLGWSWVAYHPESTIDEYPMNVIATNFGMEFFDDIIQDPTNYDGDPCKPIFHLFYEATTEPVPQIVSVEILDVNSIPTNIFTPGDTVNVRATISNPSQYRDYSVSVSMNIDEDTDGTNGVEYDSNEEGEDWDIVLPRDKQDSHSHTWSWVVPSQTEAEKTYHVAVGIHDQSNYDDICYDCSGYKEGWEFKAKLPDITQITLSLDKYAIIKGESLNLIGSITPKLENIAIDIYQVDWDRNPSLTLELIDTVYTDGGGNFLYHFTPSDSGKFEIIAAVPEGVAVIFEYLYVYEAEPIDTGFSPSVNGFAFDNFQFMGGAHCVGMSLTSLTYFITGQPLPDPGSDCNPYDSSGIKFWCPTLILIQEFQKLGNPPHGSIYNIYVILHNMQEFEIRRQHNTEQLAILKTLLPLSPQPLLLTSAGTLLPAGHCVLAYTLTEYGDNVDIYLYDPNVNSQESGCDNIIIELTKGEDGRYSMYYLGYQPVFQVFVDYTIPIDHLLIIVYSPVDIDVEDPEGYDITKQTIVNEIPGATYTETDINGDGDPDDIVLIPNRKTGDYQITVTPEPDAEPTDTYTLEVTAGGTTIVLAEDVPISDIPDQPYIIESTGTTINAAPVTDCNGPYAGNEGSSITFDASGSYDPDGSIDFYEWDFDGDGVYDFSSATSTAIFTWGDDYTGTAELRVTDNNGLSDTNTASITVNNVAPTASIVSVEQPEDFILPYHSLTFNGASTDAGWLDTHAATWDFGDGTSVSGTLTPIGTTTAEHAYAEPGTYTVTLTVTDDDGGVGDYEEGVIVISAEESTGMIIDQLAFSIVPDEAPKGVSQKIESAIAKLEQVIDFLDQGKYCDAIGKLDGMITQIEGAIDQVNEQRCSVKECKGKKCNCIADDDATDKLIESLEHAKEGAIAIRDLISAEHPECA